VHGRGIENPREEAEGSRQAPCSSESRRQEEAQRQPLPAERSYREKGRRREKPL